MLYRLITTLALLFALQACADRHAASQDTMAKDQDTSCAQGADCDPDQDRERDQDGDGDQDRDRDGSGGGSGGGGGGRN